MRCNECQTMRVCCRLCWSTYKGIAQSINVNIINTFTSIYFIFKSCYVDGMSHHSHSASCDVDIVTLDKMMSQQ